MLLIKRSEMRFKIAVLIFLLLLDVSILLKFSQQIFPQKKIISQNTIQDLSQSSSQSNSPSQGYVLGVRNQPTIYISSPKSGPSVGGVLAIASTDDPSVFISAYDISGNASITLYQVDQDTLLHYLVHDQDGKQTQDSFDLSKFQQVITFTQNITQNTKVTLPLTASGIWFLKIQIGSTATNSIIIRSQNGVLNKPYGDKYVFWSQSFTSHRSISSGSVKIYNLEGDVHELTSADFDANGIAEPKSGPNDDVALINQDGNIALVPLNLQYLNTGYSSGNRYSVPNPPQAKEFIFTDRPLYKPGDTVYFKAVVRSDDDANYTIPKGDAVVKINNGYSQNTPLFQKSYPVSSDGTISGEFVLDQGTKVGYYSLSVSLPELGDSWYTSSSTDFQVDYYRKPDYSLTVTLDKDQIIKGDKATFNVSGTYFFGQPMAGQKIQYTIYSSDYYQYEYYSSLSETVGSDYRYGSWNSQATTKGTLTLDSKGQANFTFDSATFGNSSGKNQVIGFEVQADDNSGNPSFGRKNILMYAGNFEIYRGENSNYSSAVNTPFSLPVLLIKRDENNSSISNILLTAKVHRENWVTTNDPTGKYPQTNQEKEDLPALTATTDQNGKATFNFTPSKIGSYTFTVEGHDSRGNLVSNIFYAYIGVSSTTYDYGNTGLIIQTDKSIYKPTDTAHLTITSQTPNRDVFLALERGKLSRFQIIHLSGTTGTADVTLQDSDIPNIFAHASSFSDNSLDEESANIHLSVNTKRLEVSVSSDRQKYGPSQTATLNIKTTDYQGNPVSADTAVWVVDKALFELTDARPEKIFDTFWSERYDVTQSAHSLQGIMVEQGGRGGGCFTGDTLILMADGSQKPIKDIRVGDQILTRSENSSTLVSAKVTGVQKAQDPGYLIVNKTLKITPDHILKVNDLWQEAQNIQLGDHLTDSHGKNVSVTSLEWQAGKVDVYNLEIEKYHTFFASGIWVHNQKGGAGRTVFKDTAYWNPSVHTDSSGQAQVKFKLPDNLTTWVVSAVGDTTSTMVGEDKSEIVVSQDVVIRPVLPNILRVGDNITLSALLQNFTPQSQTFNVSLDTNAAKVSDSTKTVTLTSGELQTISWNFKADKENPKANFNFTATSTNNQKIGDKVTMSIPVKPFGFWETQTSVASGDWGSTLNLAQDADPAKSTVTLSLTPSLLDSLTPSVLYLINYPYFCAEQTVSHLMPALIAKQNPTILASMQKMGTESLDQSIKLSLQRLYDTQFSDGGWTWWSGALRSDPFLTFYVTEGLVAAKNAGISIDQGTVISLSSFLHQTQYYSNDTKGYLPITPVERMLNNYSLAMLGTDQKAQTGFYDFSSLPTPDLLAIAVLNNTKVGDTNPQTNGLNLLISKAHTQGDEVYWDSGDEKNFGSVYASTALALQALIANQKQIANTSDNEMIEKAARFLTQTRKYDYWVNTFATSQTLQALVEYLSITSEDKPNYDYQALLGSDILSNGHVSDPHQLIPTINIPTNQTQGKSVSVSKNGPGQIYESLAIKQFHTDRNTKALSHGLSISRSYSSGKGSEYAIAVGDIVSVNLTVSGLLSPQNYLVIEDQLPAGLVPINDSFKNEQYNAPTTPDIRVVDKEITENGMRLYIYSAFAGQNTFSYQARVVSAGDFFAPPATATMMYSPEIYGHSAVSEISTSQVSGVIPQELVKKKLLAFVSKPGDIIFAIAAVFLAFIAYRKFIAKI